MKKQFLFSLLRVSNQAVRLALLLLLLPALLLVSPPPVAIGLSGGVLAGEAQDAQIQSELDPAVVARLATIADRIDREGAVPVIIRLRAPYIGQVEVEGGPRAKSQRAAIDAVRQRLLARLPRPDDDSIKTFRVLPFVALSLDQAGLAALQSSPELLDITEDRFNRLADLPTTPEVSGAAVKGAAGDGRGQVIALLDTGVETTHPYLTNKVIYEACFSTRSEAIGISSLCLDGRTTTVGRAEGACDPTIPSCANGTQMAGLIAGNGPELTGVAPGAELVSIKVFSLFGGFHFCGPTQNQCIGALDSDIARGLEFLNDYRRSVNLAAVSLGASSTQLSYANCDSRFSAIEAAIDLLSIADIPVIVPSGNSANPRAIASPACISNVISVGSSSPQDKISAFTNRAFYLNLLAPGEAIRTINPGGGFTWLSGTHMASAQVAGAWAVLRQRRTQARIPEVLAVLTRTGKEIIDPVTNLTYPRLQLDAALGALDGLVNPYHEPLNLSITPTGDGRLELSWKDRPIPRTGFRISRRIIDREDWRIIGTTGALETQFIDSEIVPGAIHAYRVTTLYEQSESLPSHVVSQRIPAILTGPTDLTANVLTTKQVDLTWKFALYDFDSVTLWRLDVATQTMRSFDVTLSRGSYRDFITEPGRTYEYYLTARVGGDTTPSSNRVRVVTPRVDIVVTTPDGRDLLDFGLVAPTTSRQSPAITRTFRIRNQSRLTIELLLLVANLPESAIPRIAEHYQNFPFTVNNPLSGSTEAGKDPYFLSLAPDEERVITVEFVRQIPKPSSIPLAQLPAELLPEIVTGNFYIASQARVTIDRQTLRLNGRVETPARLIHPEDVSLPPVAEFRRDGNGVEVGFSLYDPNLDLSLVTYQFYDQIGRPVGKPISHFPGPLLRSSAVMPGMSLTLRRRFSNLERFNDLRSVKVTIFDPEGSASAFSVPTPDLGSSQPR